VSVLDALSGAVLDRRVLPPFAGGVFEAWDLKGHISIHVPVRSDGSPAILSGVFFDPSPSLATISISSPQEGDVILMPTNLVLVADAVGDPNNVDHVEFYDGAVLLGAVTGPPPYRLLWSTPSRGVHRVTAREVGLAGVAQTDPRAFYVFTRDDL